MIAAVLGLQFGDEGKGKITDFLSDRFEVAVRFNGGGNAGHTVVTDGRTFKFHLVPSGSLRCETVVLGNGMVIDPFALKDEIQKLRESGGNAEIKISKMAHVVTPMHKELDKKEEEIRSKLSIGTTAQGIGPTYEDKYARTGIRMVDLLSKTILDEKVETIYRMKENLLKDTKFSQQTERQALSSALLEVGKYVKQFLDYTENIIYEKYSNGKNILFEGAQGTMLDIDFGMYPFVTSSNALSGALSTGAGFSFRKVDFVLGVVKAYTSKVGAGTFPSEIEGKEADRLRDLGHEYGTTTGRPRRVGWLDLPLLKYATRMNDVDALAITKIDTLGKMDKIKVCTGYRKNGKSIDYIPRNLEEVDGIDLELREFEPWGEPDYDKVVKNGFNGLPEKMKEYIEFIVDYLKIPVDIVSLGETRNMTIVRESSELKLNGK